MVDEQGKQSGAATRKPWGLVGDLRGAWEPEPIAKTWQHPLVTAVALVVCLTVAGWLHVREPYWAAISAVVVMQSDVGPTLSASRDRLVGTVIGAVMGWLTAVVWHDIVLVFGLAVAISLLLCGVLGLKNAGRLVGATICVVVLVPAAAGPKWRIALDRFSAVSFGVVIAVAISMLLHRWAKLRG